MTSFSYLRRPVAVSLITVAFVIFGVVALKFMRQDLLPDISEPVLVIEVVGKDMSASELQKQVTEPIESALSSLKRLQRVESSIQPGLSITKLTFDWAAPLDEASYSIREALDRLRFPKAIENPRILYFNPAQRPILRYGFTFDPVQQRQNLGRKLSESGAIRSILEKEIQTVLESLPGVAMTQILGGETQEILVEFDSQSLARLNLTLGQISDILKANTLSLPAGKLESAGQTIFLKLDSKPNSLQELANIIIKESPSGQIRLGDVAKIGYSQEYPKTQARSNLKEAVILDLYRESSGNIVDISRLVKKTLLKIKDKPWMQGIEAKLLIDQSRFIEQSIDQVAKSIIGGAVLAFCVLFLFLGQISSSSLVGISIPVAVPIALFFMQQEDISLNYMSLGGLAVGIGMLVDNSIVVLENIYRHRAMGKGLFDSCAIGLAEVRSPIISSTLTSLVVFFPLVYLEGIVGQLFGDLAKAITYSLLSSLVVALFFLPTFSYALMQIGSRKSKITSPTLRRVSSFLKKIKLFGKPFLMIHLSFAKATSILIERIYIPFLDRSLKLSSIGVLIVFALAGSLFYVYEHIEKEMLPNLSSNTLFIEGKLTPGSSIRKSSSTSFAIEDKLSQLQGVKEVNSVIGETEEDKLKGIAGSHRFQLQLSIKPNTFSNDRLDKLLSSVSGLDWRKYTPSIGIPKTGDSITLLADSPQALAQMSKELFKLLDSTNGVKNTSSIDRSTAPEYRVKLNNAAVLSYGLSAQKIVNFLGDYIKGTVIGDLEANNQNLDIRVKGTDISAPKDILSLTYPTEKGAIPLHELITLQVEPGLPSISTIDSRQALKFGLIVEKGAEKALKQKLKESNIAEHANLFLADSTFEGYIKNLMLVLFFASFFVYIILGCQFESFVFPIIIITSIPMALAGGLISMLLFDMPLTLISLIGCIVLVGVIVNNGILIVDFALEKVRSGVRFHEAVRQAASERFRPIAMTTLTTVAGLMPLAFIQGQGAVIGRSIGIPILGGLVLGSVLTLLILPMLTMSGLKWFWNAKSERVALDAAE